MTERPAVNRKAAAGSSPAVSVFEGNSLFPPLSHSFNGQDRGFLILKYRFNSCMRHLHIK